MWNLQLTRRDSLKWGVASAALLLLSGTAPAQAAEAVPFTLPALPYEVDALEPAIDTATMRIHHGKHHQAYVDRLNKALSAHPDYASWPLDELLIKLEALPESLQKDVRNHGGGHWNHSLFWKTMAPPDSASQTAPSQALQAAIDRDFGSLEALQKQFQDAGASVFGSGWVWLVYDQKEKRLRIMTTANQDNPLMLGAYTVLMGNDVWEHAYYLQYQNRRADYLKGWWGVVDWNAVSERLPS